MNSMKKMSAALLAALMLTGACAQAETVTGTATGMGAVSVELTVEDGKITAAAVDTSHETVGIGQELGEQFAAQIVEKQGEFDAVSGATITSTAVKTALSSAMQQAGLAEAASVSMTPGVYVGTARGSRSDIKMAVEVDETTIKNIWNVENGDSPVFSQMAIDAMADEIVDAQSLAVDTYTGATISSRGAIMAVENALRQAGIPPRSMPTAWSMRLPPARTSTWMFWLSAAARPAWLLRWRRIPTAGSAPRRAA